MQNKPTEVPKHGEMLPPELEATFKKIAREYWGDESDLSDEELESFADLKTFATRCYQQGREDERKEIKHKIYNFEIIKAITKGSHGE